MLEKINDLIIKAKDYNVNISKCLSENTFDKKIKCMQGIIDEAQEIKRIVDKIIEKSELEQETAQEIKRIVDEVIKKLQLVLKRVIDGKELESQNMIKKLELELNDVIKELIIEAKKELERKEVDKKLDLVNEPEVVQSEICKNYNEDCAKEQEQKEGLNL